MSDAHRASHGKVLALLDLGACSTARDVCWGEHVCAPTVMGLPGGWRGLLAAKRWCRRGRRIACLSTNLLTAHGCFYKAFNFLLEQGLWQAGMSSSAIPEMPFPICLSSTTQARADPTK